MLKKAKAIISVVLAVSGAASLGGCSYFTSDGDSLLRPPRPTGDKAAIQNMIAREAGGSYNLKYPQKGENRSAIMLRNENTENEYAIALYSTENDTKLNVSIIAYFNSEWKCLGTYSNNCSGVDRVLFSDLNSDKQEEVIIGWTSYNSSHKTLTAYSIDADEVYEMPIDESYDELVIADLTNDLTDDILLLSLSTQEMPSAANLLQYSDPDKRPVGKYSLELDPEVIAFSNILVGDVATNTEVKISEVRTTSSAVRAERSEGSSQGSKTPDKENSAAAGEPPDGENDSEQSADSGNDTEQSADTGNDSEQSADGENDGEQSADSGNDTEQSADSGNDTEQSADSGSDGEQSADGGSDSEQSADSGNDTEQSEDWENDGEKTQESKPAVKTFDNDAVFGKRGVVIDCKRSDNTFCTQMVYYDNLSDELIDPIARKKDGSAYVNSTLRTEAVFSQDINGDEVIEVPVSVQMNASADENGAAVCNMTAWCNYDARERRSCVALNTVMNLKDGYYFVMPERWIGKVTARSDAETREMSFFIWNTKTSSTGDRLLTISRITEQQWAEDQGGRIMLDLYPENGKAVYAAEIIHTNADESLNISEKELSDSVFLI